MESTQENEMTEKTIQLRCRAERNATADRFQKTQCPNSASTEAGIGRGGTMFPVCRKHADARSTTLYMGKGWRRAF